MMFSLHHDVLALHHDGGKKEKKRGGRYEERGGGKIRVPKLDIRKKRY